MRRIALFICGLKLMVGLTQMTPEAQQQRWPSKAG
jgi:hypothetical protein